MVANRSLLIHDGMWNVSEQTMTFSNIQNISVKQGPVQQLLAIANVEVRTAGGKPGESDADGSVDGGMHVGRFRGADNAQEIHDLIKDEMQTPPVDKPQSPGSTLQAARALVEEARLLLSVVGEGQP